MERRCASTVCCCSRLMASQPVTTEPGVLRAGELAAFAQLETLSSQTGWGWAR